MPKKKNASERNNNNNNNKSGGGGIPGTSLRTTTATTTTVFSTTPFQKTESTRTAAAAAAAATANTKTDTNTDIVQMRADIERMREEAAQRLEALNEKLVVVSKQKEAEAREATKADQTKKATLRTVLSNPLTAALTNPTTTTTNQKQNQKTSAVRDTTATTSVEHLAEIADAFERDMKDLNAARDESTTTHTIRHPLKLLDDTRWRLVLNVGRVPGTWMPKTWGASGEKLRLKLEVEFTSEELYEREDFFGGLSDGSKVLRVVHNEASLSPSMTEGGKTVRVTSGGWKVAPHEGPLGTAVLRFYFDIEEETRHLGSDVYLPKGRVYGTCGYFPLTARSNVDGRGTSKRELYEQEFRQLEVRYRSLRSAMERDHDLVSFDKLKRFKEMRDIQKSARKVRATIDEEWIREPNKSSLRMSRDQSVGLTQNGGICLKKQNGLAQEYHVLGGFEVAAMENRDHSDYKDSLLP
mmetsp:Transcript_15369/g.35219  ORF Transcript_15369/g.35219 Transcript_15369/m.35219 type:complete len:468 (-) Transcript_15369:292-1695(-)